MESAGGGGAPAANAGAAVSGDLLVKYQKIAAEYSKVRAQVMVLKKAVMEEQNRNSELREALRQLEQNGRKTEQEIDSLTFRNQQLTRRVTVLQDELELQQYKGKKKTKPQDEHQNSDFTNHVIDEEFRKKIAENAELLSSMHEKDEAHSQEVVILTDQVDRLQRLLEQAQKSSGEAEEKYKSLVTRLEREKTELREGQEGLEGAAEELSQLQRAHTLYKTDMESQLSSAKSIITTHLPFIDSNDAEVNSLNVLRYSETKRQSLPSTLVQQVWTELAETTGALAELHQQSEMRLEALPHSQSSLNKKYLSLVKESSDLALELKRGLRDVGRGVGEESADSKVALQRIPNLLANYCTHLERLMPLIRIALEGEEIQVVDEDVKLCNQQVAARTSQLVSHCVQLNSVITLISKQKSFQQSSRGWQQRHEQELIDIFSSIHEDAKEMFSAYISKFSKECDRPDLSEELKLANASITSALSKFMDSTAKVVSGLKQLWRSSAAPKTQHPAVTELSKRAAHFFNCLDTEESPSVPYLEALKDLEEARNGIELRRGLQRRLDEAQANIVRVDQECERWKNEHQLLSERFLVDFNKSDVPNSSVDAEGDKITNMIGSLSCPVNMPAEIHEREETVKRYFRERMDELIRDKREAESKAATFSTECSALARRLESSLETLNKGEANLQEMREKVVHLQEELSTTASSYEAQLSTMSDHLATMNERLAAQRETIDHLQYQMNSKGSKKGKK